MVLEVAPLRIRAGQEPAFEAAFAVAQGIIASMPGYRSHELQRCVERPGEYLLLVRWDSLEAHVQGFRGSPRYAEWRALLHHFYDPFPTVSHYVEVGVAAVGAAEFGDSGVRGVVEVGTRDGSAATGSGHVRR